MRAFVLAVLVLAAAAPAGAEQADTAVTKVQGDVTILRGQAAFAAEEGTRLAQGDVIRTGPGATADFTMNALAGCRVTPETECAVEDPKKSSMRLRLAGGKMLLNLEKLPEKSSFKVETPTAIAAVRGTQFSAEAAPDGRSSFAVRDDVIEVLSMGPGGEPSGDPVIVEAGFALDAGPDGFALRPASGLELTSIEQVGTIKTCA